MITGRPRLLRRYAMSRGLAVAIGATGALAPVSAQAQAEDIARRTLPAVARILTFDASGQALAEGSGFIIDTSGKLVTNAHVIRGASQIEVDLTEGQAFREVRVLAYDSTRDVAVLKIPGYGLCPLPLASATARPAIGATVYVVGNPLGLDRTFSDGLVSGWRHDGDRTLLQMTAPISPGSSGGPVLDRTGHVVGVATATLTEGQNLNLAVPVNTVREVLTHTVPDGLPLPLGAPTVAESPPQQNAVLELLRELPLSWTVDGVKRRLGTPAVVDHDGALTILHYAKDGLGTFGDLRVFVDTGSGESFGDFSYAAPFRACAQQFDFVRAMVTDRFGSPVLVNDARGACDVATIRWDDRADDRMVIVLVAGESNDDGSRFTRVMITYGRWRPLPTR